MKIFKSLPTQTAFFDRYANLIHTLTRFAVIAQIITGLAEIGIIYSLIYPSFADLFPSIAHHASITGSLLAASILQVGLKLVFPYSVRAILFRRFTGLDLPLSIAVFILTASLLTVSVLLSYKGSQDIVEVAVTAPPIKTTTATDSIRAATERQAAEIFTTDSATIETKYKGKIEATQSSYDNQIANIEKWSKGKKATSLRAEKVTKLATLQADKAAEIEKAAAERKATINRALDRNDTEIKAIATNNSEAKAATEQRKGKYKNYVGYFTLFCYIFFLLAFILDEIYKKGSGITETPQPHQRHFLAPLLAELSEAVKARIDTNLRTMIYQFADKTKATPLPIDLNPLYDFKPETLTNIHTVEPDKVETKVIKIPTKPLRVAAKAKDDTIKKDDSEPKKQRSIGFKMQDDTKDDTTEKRDDSGVHNDFRYKANLKDDTGKNFTVAGTTSGDFGKCENCGNDFFRNHKKQRFCCEDCRKTAWKNKTGVDFDLEVKNKERRKKI